MQGKGCEASPGAWLTVLVVPLCYPAGCQVPLSLHRAAGSSDMSAGCSVKKAFVERSPHLFSIWVLRPKTQCPQVVQSLGKGSNLYWVTTGSCFAWDFATFNTESKANLHGWSLAA